MTPEEINKRVEKALVDSLAAAYGRRESEFVAIFAEAVRELVAQAYEEAAQVLDQYPMAADYAPEIRALKDSLVETVPS